ncbi:hypothetical protein B0H14DRAFT_2693786, partial [Mycena olivaceomarginata]
GWIRLTRAVPWWIRARGCRRHRGGEMRGNYGAGVGDSRVAAEGTQVWMLRRRAPEAELAPWVRERGSAAGRMRSGMGVPTRRQVWTRIGTGVVETKSAEHARVAAGQNGRGSAWGAVWTRSETGVRGGRGGEVDAGRDGRGSTRDGRGSSVDVEQYGWRVSGGADGGRVGRDDSQRGRGGWERMAAEVGVKLVFGRGRGRRDEWFVFVLSHPNESEFNRRTKGLHAP